MPGALGRHRRGARRAVRRRRARVDTRRRKAASPSSPSAATAAGAGAAQRHRRPAAPRRQAAWHRRAGHRLWYPIWDAGLKLGHAVRTLDDQLALAARRPRHGHLAAQRPAPRRRRRARLPARHRGPGALAPQRARAGSTHCARRSSSAGPRRARSPSCSSPTSRRATAGCATCTRCGGPRDADLLVPADDLPCSTLLRHAPRRAGRAAPRTGRPGDVLRLEDQDAVAARLGAASADVLMADIAAAARTHRLDRRRGVAPRVPAPARPRGARRRRAWWSSTGEVELTARADLARRPGARPAGRRVAAQRDVATRRARRSIAWPPRSTPADWRRAVARRRARRARRPAPARATGDRRARGARPAGHPRAPAARSGSRCAVARSATPTTASPSTGTCGRRRPTPPRWPTGSTRPDLLVLGALLHDIGKGYPGDHTEAGMELVRAASAPRIGARRRRRRRARARWSSTTCCCPTSPPAATSTDPATIRTVADAVGDAETLDLLHALTEADSLATGPVGVGLVEGGARRRPRRPHAPRARRRRASATPTWRRSPTRRRCRRWRRRSTCAPSRDDATSTTDRHRADHRRVRRRARARSAGSPACCRCTASTCSRRGRTPASWAGRPMAASQFRVAPPRGGVDWEPVRRRPAPGAAPASWRSRPGWPSGPAPTAGGEPLQAAAGRAAVGDVPRRRVDTRRPCSRCGRRTRSACCTASPRRWPSSASTSATPRCRRSARRSSTRSTCAAATGG